MKTWTSYFITILFCFPIFSNAQSGDFFVTQHSPEGIDVDNISFDLISDNNGLLVVANRSGVLIYDGSSWDFYPTPSAALSLAVDENNTIYVGCVGQYGKLDYTQDTFKYVPLFASDSSQELFIQTIANDNHVYFFGGEGIHVFDIEKQRTNHHGDEYLNIYQFYDEVFANAPNGTFRLNGDVMTHEEAPLEIAYTFQSKNQTFASDLDGYLYQITSKGWEELPHNEKLSSMEVYISGAVALNDTLIACSTLTNGCIFLNVNDTSYFEVVDYHSGLPDNEVFAINIDEENGVWVAHEFGLTRIAPLFPAHSYSHYPGLEGNLFSAAWVDETLWVSSSLGVYYFDKDTAFTEKVYYVAQNRSKRQRTVNVAVEPNPEPEESISPLLDSTQLISDTITFTENKKRGIRGFFSNLFRKKEKALVSASPNDSTILSIHQERVLARKAKREERKRLHHTRKIVQEYEVVTEEQIDKFTATPTEASKVKYIRKTKKIPSAVSFRFTKVPNASGKFKELVQYKDKLLGASTSGVFEIDDTSSHLVIHEPVRTIQYLEKTDQLLVDTYNRELKLFTLEDHIWIELDELELDDIILSTYEDSEGGLWLIGTSSIFQASLQGTHIEIDTTYEVDNTIFDIMNVISIRDTLTFINYQGYFYLDREKGKIVENETLKLEIGLPRNHFQDQQGNIWIFNGKIWYTLSENGLITPYEYLSIFKDLRFVSYDEKSGRYWLITKDNELLNYDIHVDTGIGDAYQMFLKRVSSQSRAIDHDKLFTVNYDEGNLSFELARPEYAGFLNLEYQYLLNGLHQGWSSWSGNNIIDFTYLPPGNYELLVRTRDAFGRTEQHDVISFKVSAPYWQQPWFYALQVMFFGALMIISFRLNQSNTKNQLLSEGLTILTVILVIEFLQSLVGSYVSVKSSPTVDFLVDASVALLIFPFERFLRIYLTGDRITVQGFRIVRKKAAGS